MPVCGIQLESAPACCGMLAGCWHSRSSAARRAHCELARQLEVIVRQRCPSDRPASMCRRAVVRFRSDMRMLHSHACQQSKPLPPATECALQRISQHSQICRLRHLAANTVYSLKATRSVNSRCRSASCIPLAAGHMARCMRRTRSQGIHRAAAQSFAWRFGVTCLTRAFLARAWAGPVSTRAS